MNQKSVERKELHAIEDLPVPVQGYGADVAPSQSDP